MMWWLVGLSALIVVAALGIMPALYNGILSNVNGVYSKVPAAINDLGMALLWLGLLAAVGWAAYRGGLVPLRLAG